MFETGRASVPYLTDLMTPPLAFQPGLQNRVLTQNRLGDSIHPIDQKIARPVHVEVNRNRKTELWAGPRPARASQAPLFPSSSKLCHVARRRTGANAHRAGRYRHHPRHCPRRNRRRSAKLEGHFTNEETAATTTTTNPGRIHLTPLRIGRYSVEVKATGFQGNAAKVLSSTFSSKPSLISHCSGPGPAPLR